MNFRKATINDLDTLFDLEAQCFPIEEAASLESIRRRLTVFPNYFWLLEENGKVISMINGMATDEKDLTDEMYDDATMHKPTGKWQMIFGVDTLPSHQHHGYASKVMHEVIRESKANGKSGIVLTCKDRLIGFYEQFGYVNDGISTSVHGGVVWYQMRLTF